MDFYLHHINSTVFLTTLALLLTIISYILKSTIFCGRCCKSLALCFHYNLPSQDQHVGFTSNIGIVKPILRKSLPVTELSEIIVEKADTSFLTTSPTSSLSSPKPEKKKDSYSFIWSLFNFSKWQKIIQQFTTVFVKLLAIVLVTKICVIRARYLHHLRHKC